MITKIWQHITTGERYAVALDSYGWVVGAAGPLHHSEIAQAKTGDWNSDPEVTADIRDAAGSYRDVTDRA